MKKTFSMSGKKFLLLLLAVSLLRLLFTAFQRATFEPDTSMLDDFLVYEAAKNITAGKWLGAYGFMTIGKHMLFSVWLAFLNVLHIPFLFAGQFLYTVSCIVLILAFSPVIRNKLYLLLFYAFLVFNPASYADFTLRVYRDNITISVALLVFASVIGFALRVKDGTSKSLWGYGVLGGLSIGASFLLREDGIWLLPFVVVGAGISLLLIFRESKGKLRITKLAALSMTAVLSVAGILIYCSMNYAYYGRFIISDMTSKEFYDACGAMTRVIVPDDEYNPIVTLPYSSRKKLYDACPTFAKLEPYIESEEFHRMKKDVGNGVQDISGGGYYWAVRNAAILLGYYDDAETAKQFYLDLAVEINEACDSGKIPSTKKRSGLNAPVTADRFAPTFEQTFNEIKTVLFYLDIDCAPKPSTGSDRAIFEMEDYLHSDAFRLDREYKNESLAIITVYSKEGPVSVDLTDLSGTPITTMIRNTTGSDIYVKHLLTTGEDTLYTDNLRLYVTVPNQVSDYLIRLSSNEKTDLVPIEETKDMVKLDNLEYSIEYVGQYYDELSTASYSFFEIWSYRIMRAVVILYRVINPLLFLVGILGFLLTLIRLLQNKRKKVKNEFQNVLLFWISAGILLIALFRLVMMAFVEVTAFGIGTFPMYFAIAYPLFIAFGFSSIWNYLKLYPLSFRKKDNSK